VLAPARIDQNDSPEQRKKIKTASPPNNNQKNIRKMKKRYFQTEQMEK
jgi:hypothetical protein